jgi:type VI secretion system (T6SS) baseplate-like injector VgrG
LTLPSDLHRHAGRYYGKYSGEVTDPSDPEKLGRIKVSVPSVFPPDVEVWARPCFASGHFFLPPAQTKVWVEFEAGNTSYPLWVGTWYPQGQLPPDADRPYPAARVVHTPSGHVIELSDEDGKEKVVIRHKLDSFVSIDEKGSVLAANQKGSYLFLNAEDAEVSVTSEQGHMVTLGGDGVVALHNGGSRVEIADGKVKIAGTSSVQVVADELSLAARSVSLGGQALMKAVLGDLMVQAFNAHVHPTAMGPTGPPVPPMIPNAVLSNSVKVQP